AGLLSEEMGRCLLPSPYLGSMMAQKAILLAGTEEQRERWVRPIIAGETVATIALAEPNGGWDPADIRLAAMRGGEGWVLRGEKVHVLFGSSAGLILVPARGQGGAISPFALALPNPPPPIVDR